MKIQEAILSGKPFKLPKHEDWIIIDKREGGFFAYWGKLKYAEQPELSPDDILSDNWKIKS